MLSPRHPIAFVPRFQQQHAAVKSVEDQQRQPNPGYNAPGEDPEESQLELLRDPILRDHGVKGPQDGIAKQQKGDHLSGWLGYYLKTCYAGSLRRFGDQRALGEALDQL